MTQRDRLLAVLDNHAYWAMSAEDLADALLARGVRVVDEDTLTKAVSLLPDYTELPSYRRYARAILAMLDSLP